MSEINNQEGSNLKKGFSNVELFMFRCIDLAKLGAGYVAPNPMVGAVLVYEDRIIGEGYHQQYGKAHAEVNCLASVRPEDVPLMQKSKLYVSLEPCSHHGKTPPCADLIIQQKIPEVIIGCRDPFPEVNGKGIEKLKAAGVKVTQNILETECKDLNKRFFLFHAKKRPFIILKWAQSADGYIASADQSRTNISNEYTNGLVHRWRTEEAAILVGTNTALHDDPMLTARNWKGTNPVRLVTDSNLRLPQTLKLFDQQTPTIVFNNKTDLEKPNLRFYRIQSTDHFLDEMLDALYQFKIQSVMVEGGGRLLQAFIEKGYWDEARVIANEQLYIGRGVSAPVFSIDNIIWEKKILSDRIVAIKNER